MGWSIHHPSGLIHYAPRHASRGYTLFTNLQGYHANLIDMEGRICHRWYSPEGANYGYLLPNGHLLLLTHAPGEPVGASALGGSSASLIELDWESNVVWRYRNSLLHHDFVRLLNGNTLVMLWGVVPADVTRRINGGFRADDDPDEMFGDVVCEIETDGTVVNEWRVWEHLNPEEDAICPLEGRQSWTHGNSLNVTPNGDLLVSYRHISTVGIVDRSNGEFRWKWGPGKISHQHNPTILENGNILLFDNGSHRRAPSTNYSRVIEVEPATNEIAWEYRGDPPISFYSYQISGAERLPNGNTLICEGAPGRIFEITPDHQIVWEYINPYFASSGRVVGSAISGQANSVFRAHRYSADDTALIGKDLDPDRYANMNRLYAGV